MTSAKVGAGTEERASEMDGWWERTDHPLLNDVVLKILFESMSGKDLKQCRLVCKEWCLLTLPFTRSKFTVKLRGNDEEITKRLTDFVQVFRQNKMGIPFAKYKLDPFCTTGGPGQEYLQMCGSTAKKVSMKKRSIPEFTVEVEDISEILKTMPNIEVFGISHRIHSRSGNVVRLFPDNLSPKPTLTFLRKLIVCDSHRTNDYCPTFIEDILSVAPNVSDFKIEDSSVGCCGVDSLDPDRSRIGQTLNAIETFGRESIIRNLHFGNAKTEHFESLLRLAESGLKLKKLYIYHGHLGPGENLFKFLPPLATLFKNSIEDLLVEEVFSSFIELPYMPRLEILKFCISKDFDSKSVILNKLFPALKELYLDCLYYVHGYEFEELLPNSEPCPNVKTLSLVQVDFKIQVFNHILNIFPNLTKFELNVKTDGAQIVREIMTQMTQLEDLSLSGEIEGIESIDAFLAGIPIQKIEEYQELVHVVSELKEMPVQLRAETIRDYRTRYCLSPSIANLTILKIQTSSLRPTERASDNFLTRESFLSLIFCVVLCCLTDLKKLHLNTSGSCDDQEECLISWYTRVTDVFAYFGLYSMKHIKELELENCEFTKATCEVLTAEMELEAWSFIDYDGPIIPEV